jgi:uncharacterized protein YigE (DUF2233 family)
MAQGTQSFCERRSFETAEFMVCKFDTRTDSLLLTSQYRKFKELEKSLGGDAADVRFAMNAGMYDKAGAPIGLLVAGGKELKAINTRTASGNFYLKPNGVFWVDTSGAHAAPTDIYVAKQARPDWATQSGPMLVIGGALHPDIQDDGPSRYLRNGVGVSDAHTALFVISEAPVSFGKLARFFRDELKCPDALYLDGAVSSLWLPSAGRMDSAFDLGPMIVVSDRK